MSLQAGGLLACGIWLALNMYGAVLSFQHKSPIYSYLDSVALIIQGIICVAFSIGAIFTVFSLITAKPLILRYAHRMMWVLVFIFIINFFVDLIVFGVQRPQFIDWCTGRSRSRLDDQQSNDLPEQSGDEDVYNCNKLWEAELKFAIVVFIMISLCFMYWALCIWSYSQKQISLLQTYYGYPIHPSAAAAAATMHGPAGVMHNIGRSKAVDGGHHPGGGGKSLAQVSRQALDSIYSLFTRDHGATTEKNTTTTATH
ncbi:hypothetical protein O0I10_005661 [Lichtheimia ornata]|uniref:Uncharacterized protein n=1 Tax=Lichtheimia ornata TaxID=688661 RepID=A0AAD7V4Y1_9FUNG|nr:uncharacterized protein O0I10_005661 [Lichtheimia ornata]KAJ8658621.1 hypothetical protein O0I10_005661 [Lichtheimia ornata]